MSEGQRLQTSANFSKLDVALQAFISQLVQGSDKAVQSIQSHTAYVMNRSQRIISDQIAAMTNENIDQPTQGLRGIENYQDCHKRSG